VPNVCWFMQSRQPGSRPRQRLGDEKIQRSSGGVSTASFPWIRFIQNYWIPAIRASIELDRNNADKAIELLQAAVPYELADPPPFSAGTMYPAYLRGEAYLFARKGSEAAVGSKRSSIIRVSS
jgi:hypothetical protein